MQQIKYFGNTNVPKEITESFNLWDIINLVRSPKWQKDAARKYNGGQVYTPSARFTGLSSLEEIDEILNREVTQSNEVLQHNRTFDMVSDVCGSVVNMDAFIQGQPEDMYNFVSSESNIVEDLNIFISISADTPVSFIQRAANNIKEYIESRPSNVSFNINLRSDGHQYNDKTRKRFGVFHTLIVRVASADDYLTPQVINLLGHPMFYRYFILQYKAAALNSNTTAEPTPEGWTDFLTFNKTWS